MVSKSLASVASLVIAFAATQVHAQYVNCPAASDFVVMKDVAAGSTVVNSGGAVGGEFVTYTFKGADGVDVSPTGTAPSLSASYWFFKFDTAECYDMSGYNAVEFDMTAPVGSNFSMTFTVHAANCSSVKTCAGLTEQECPRQPDSTYVSIEPYAKPNGSKQTVKIPLADFLPNSQGTGNTDFYHIKDWTFIGYYPGTANTVFNFNNFILKAGCTKGIASPPADRPGVSTRPSGQDPNFNSTSATTASSVSTSVISQTTFATTSGSITAVTTGSKTSSSTSTATTSRANSGAGSSTSIDLGFALMGIFSIIASSVIAFSASL